MPRKAFVADLQTAIDGVSVAGISNVARGSDDGEFTFQCSLLGETLTISALVPDLGDYPDSHMYYIFAKGEDVPKHIADKFASIGDDAFGKNVNQLLRLVASKLGSADKDGDTEMLNSQEFDDFDDDEDEDYSEDEYFPDDDHLPKSDFNAFRAGAASNNPDQPPTSAFKRRIRSDLLLAKANGFKVGSQGGLLEGEDCYLSLSCRMSKLGISEEAMQAWNVEPNQYLILILHFPLGYKCMDSYREYDSITARSRLEMRVGISNHYKPSLQEALRAFDQFNKKVHSEGGTQPDAAGFQGFRDCFISRPLNELLNERFASLLGSRYAGMSWLGAEAFYNDHQGASKTSDHLADNYLEQDTATTLYPLLVVADHITASSTDEAHSLPLVAMQFVLRHFVRCTEFCLVCFTKLPNDLQALKPYVCDKPLCLYQYMSLGFGPSIEHEIASQPSVVDLLISFCYASATTSKLKDFPTGLCLNVPPPSVFRDQALPDSRTPGARGLPATYKVSFFKIQKDGSYEILFDKPSGPCPLRKGDWIVVGQTWHCRVTDASLYPTVRLAQPVISPAVESKQYNNSQNPSPDPNPMPKGKVSMVPYGINFDDLNEDEKRTVIPGILSLLPSVAEMKMYVTSHRHSTLRGWVDRLSPAAVGILRWIIASNRACIVQVDDDAGDGKKGEQRLYGMNGWTQFRFAMGAPDKERRFVQAVRETKERLKLKHATIFAWHGSPLWNWHSIIREGLHFDFTAHGRAYGNGVYHSLDVNTSLGYSGGYPGSGPYGRNGCWPHSELRVTSALALNEIVNAPKEFVSSSPHLVVHQLDWIQTRYLFISKSPGFGAPLPAPLPGQPNISTLPAESKPLEFIEQDPLFTPRGSTDTLVIPVHAISSSRRPTSRKQSKQPAKKLKGSGKSAYDPINLDDDDDDGASIATLEEDRAILHNEELYQPSVEEKTLSGASQSKGKGKAGGFLSRLVGSSKPSKPLTDFVPGSLDHSSLELLPPPAWATSTATKRLAADFKELVKIQSKEPLHEVGWYIDPEHVSNMYQWIVELHSFDASLPLAKDMKDSGITSIVMELRFGKEYPMAPPFVRVIRPRFLGFQQGGGGHVTLGGALCMELLTNDGWSAVSTIESVLLQVRMAISSTDPRPARLDKNFIHSNRRSGAGTAACVDYGIGEAVEAYIRACNVHGWTVPPGLRETAYGGDSGKGQPWPHKK